MKKELSTRFPDRVKAMFRPVFLSTVFSSIVVCSAILFLIGVPLGSVALSQIRDTNAKDETFFVAERSHHAIAILNSRGKRIQEIHGPVGNLATDEYGDLFVADFLGLDYVNEYKPPYNGAPIRLYLKHNQIAWGVASDPRTGILAVLSVSNSGFGTDYISFFRHNSTTPCNVVPQGNDVQVFGTAAALDAEGTLFFEGLTNGQESITVASLAGECDARIINALSFAQPIDPYGYMAFDQNDNFVIQAAVNDQPGPIFIYRHPRSGIFASPIAATFLGAGHYSPSFLALTSDGKYLWAGDYYGTDVLLYPYPGATSPVLKVSAISQPLAGAVFPPLVP